MFFKNSIYLCAGILFGFGLALSGMTDPKIVTGFLDIFGQWDMSLMFVMIGGIGIVGVGYRLIFKKNQPIFENQFYVSQNDSIDKPLIIGAILFGLGWGLYGFCPGPALASLASLNLQTFAFVISMALGMLLTQKLLIDKKLI